MASFLVLGHLAVNLYLICTMSVKALLMNAKYYLALIKFARSKGIKISNAT